MLCITHNAACDSEYHVVKSKGPEEFVIQVAPFTLVIIRIENAGGTSGWATVAWMMIILR